MTIWLRNYHTSLDFWRFTNGIVFIALAVHTNQHWIKINSACWNSTTFCQMLKKWVWNFPQPASKPRTGSQTVGKETIRKFASAFADNVNIQEQSCREKKFRKKERVPFRCWTFCQWWKRTVFVDAGYCQQNAPQTLYPKTRPNLLVDTTDFKNQRCDLSDFTSQELLELKYWNFKTFL
jgi:hypothetical protein